ncbi:HlyD family type I secretion periplasmic adaptor subunit [Xenorhabdus nematophila]|uniref:HlyD family type I secretion periplasmic adaptor subunit n=1 Tax=Xenorhabdus nematophila TaxID=628 RepID=UPI000543B22E|nr:HlyD family type I secretion periplasmic adaptor subunit [Xenorhabdus nematophila]CEE90767.1 Alkaline protease secretion protein aprE [Xenorhabdus nematophila str. Anatoliense]CEF28930.1 Alkaline protease secretion protein aprE [Xenorhabdus nematophila str. Websteri]AYA42140.1 HlyD family type I secretion periplasmic adaptor subunit [Xenorhabdus nematophila]KHD29613.1 hemolysin D [Xenorhabdus nematophila]MBA0020864.1 HlyD family type I secretion periplasmic adaptor subunit [Xenorhabdus nema
MSDQTNAKDAPKEALELLPLDANRYLQTGWLIIGIGILGFLIWAAFAPLDKGVASSGMVVVDGNRKTVQSPANGIIRQIQVKEGQQVKAGQVLVQLSQVQVNAQIDSFKQQLYTTLATEARLLAEQQGIDDIVFPSALLNQQSEPRINDTLALQKQLFASRREMLRSDLAGMRQAEEGLNFQIKGLREARVSKQQQQSSLKEQIANLRPLTEEGYFPRNRYLELLRSQSELSGSLAEMTGRMGQLEKQQQETQQRVIQRQADYQREVRTQLADVQVLANELRNKLEAAQFDLSHTSIIAPVEGSVVGLTVFTQGGVVASGEKLMEILPAQSALEVEARLMVHLIDKIAVGQDVDLMFTAFNQSRTPKVTGKVTVVSADRLVDGITREPYYQMRLRVAPEGMEKLAGLNIKPGMPVEVFVKTGSRSLLSYLFKPLMDRASTSLIEE